MANIDIYEDCPQCGGDGIRELYNSSLPPELVEVTCGYCGGTGRIISRSLDGTVINDILDKCNDILNKCDDILEQLST